MLTQQEKIERLYMSIALIQDADAGVQAALGDTEECFDLHCGIQSMADDIAEVVGQLDEMQITE